MNIKTYLALAFAFLLSLGSPTPVMSQGIDGFTVLMLHGDGSSGSSSFPDSSQSAHAQAAYGATVNTSTNKFGTGSIGLNGASWVGVSNGADLDFGSGDFTIDFWSYQTASGGVSIARTQSHTYPAFLIYSNSSIYMSSNGTSWDVSAGNTIGTPPLNAWSWQVLQRKGSNFYAIRDCVLRSTWASSASLPAASAPLSVGSGQSGNYFNGYIDELRISKGIARIDVTGKSVGDTVCTAPTQAYSQPAPPATLAFGQLVDTPKYANNSPFIVLKNTTGQACTTYQLEARNFVSAMRSDNTSGVLTVYGSTDNGTSFDRGPKYNTTGSSIFPGESNPDYMHQCLTNGKYCPAPYAFGLPQKLSIGMRIGVDLGTTSPYGQTMTATIVTRGMQNGIAHNTSYSAIGTAGATGGTSNATRSTILQPPTTWFPADPAGQYFEWAIPLQYGGWYMGAPGQSLDAFYLDMSGDAYAGPATPFIPNIVSGEFKLRCMD